MALGKVTVLKRHGPATLITGWGHLQEILSHKTLKMCASKPIQKSYGKIIHTSKTLKTIQMSLHSRMDRCLMAHLYLDST